MKVRAIILKKQSTNEYDQLVTCYTEEFGKITAVAKSSLRPTSIQAMHLDTFNLVEFDLISGRGMPIITGAQVESAYPDLKTDLNCLAVAYFFVEVTDKIFFEYQKDEIMWNFLSDLLVKLNFKPADLGGFLKSKQAKLLDILGYAPNLIVFKNGIWHNPEVIGSIFENLAEKKIYSLKLISN